MISMWSEGWWLMVMGREIAKQDKMDGEEVE
jgi:hypothetical protein